MIRRLLNRLGQWLVAKTDVVNSEFTIDLEAAQRGYVRQFGKHAKYGDPSRVIVGVTSAAHGPDYAAANAHTARSYHDNLGLSQNRKVGQ